MRSSQWRPAPILLKSSRAEIWISARLLDWSSIRSDSSQTRGKDENFNVSKRSGMANNASSQTFREMSPLLQLLPNVGENMRLWGAGGRNLQYMDHTPTNLLCGTAKPAVAHLVTAFLSCGLLLRILQCKRCNPAQGTRDWFVEQRNTSAKRPGRCHKSTRKTTPRL